MIHPAWRALFEQVRSSLFTILGRSAGDEQERYSPGCLAAMRMFCIGIPFVPSPFSELADPEIRRSRVCLTKSGRQDGFCIGERMVLMMASRLVTRPL